MNKKTIIIIIIAIIIIAGIGYWIYQSMTTPEELTEKEQACINSGGKVSTSLCCGATDDFPNFCLIGPCGCSPENSHEVKTCDCGPDKCFDGNKCVSLDETSGLLRDLKQETGIDFSEEKDVEFPWYIDAGGGSGEVAIQGKGFEVMGVSSQDHKDVESFFENNGFEIDLYNVASGTVAGLTGYKRGEIVCTVAGRMWLDKEGIPIEEDKNDVEVKCGKLAETADWNSYTNEKHGYSFKYPKNCLYGVLPGECKQSPPEERPEECLCFLNAENLDEVSLGTFTGEKPILSGASFIVSHHSTDVYNPPEGVDLIEWLKEKFITLDIPNRANIEIGGVPGAKVYVPQSPMAFSYEEIFFIKDNKLFKINMIDVDNENNRELYDKILSTFKFLDAEVANPAAVYCLEIGGELMHIVDKKGSSGYCILPDSRICAQWKLFYSEGEECVPPEE